MNGSVTSMNSRLAFVIFGSFYFSVLLISYWISVFYPFFTPYGWFVIPVVANFFVGYSVREVDTSANIIIACFLLQTGIIIGLLNIPLVYSAFLSHLIASPLSSFIDIYKPDPSGTMLIVIVGYPIAHFCLGIAAAGVGMTVRDYSRLLLERSRKVKFLFVMGILLLMGTVSTWVSSDFYRVEDPILWFGDPVNLISCGFPLPYLHSTNSSMITISIIAESLGIQPFNHTNFLLDTLFYTSVYSIIIAFSYTIIRSKKMKQIIEKLSSKV